MNWRYRSSGYDPDPGALTGAIPGFVELSNLYSLYRVRTMILTFTPLNPEVNQVMVVSWPSTENINNNSLSSSDLLEYSSNVYAKQMVAPSSSAGGIRKIKVTARGNELFGPTYNTDLDFSSSTSTNPVAMYYINIGLIQPQGNFTYSFGTLVRIVYCIEFFERRTLES